ncbi:MULTISPECIES: hypothetical protein [Pseudomonas]|uniref:hypothetical protein n=1 Tax=Pseudomonas TaxID=286 RepID=UPI000AB158EA|nr:MULTISPECIES: hypothetical protein [Pseudomonas]
MKLIQCRFSSGQRVPLLVQTGDAAPLPILVPFIYVQLKLRYRAYNTTAAHLRAIQAFYIYAKSRDLNFRASQIKVVCPATSFFQSRSQNVFSENQHPSSPELGLSEVGAAKLRRAETRYMNMNR